MLLAFPSEMDSRYNDGCRLVVSELAVVIQEGSMPRDFGKLIQSFFEVSETYGDACWCPSVDIYRGRESWLVKFDLAGVGADDVQLRVHDRNLIVAGIRRDFSVLEGQQAYSMEISYNRFQRSVELPFDLSDAQIRSEYRDGMFLVLITPRGSQV